MVRFTAILKKFATQGEKTGWTYIEIPEAIAIKLLPGKKTSFRVKGKLDELRIDQVALLPMGGGDFIMPINAAMRKGIGKRQGAGISVILEADNSAFQFSEDFMACLNDDPAAMNYFKSLPMSHQKYFSKWIDSAKSIETKTKRITMAIKALAQKKGYGEMLREQKQQKN